MTVSHPAAFAAEDVAIADALIERFGRLAHALLPGLPRDERTLSRLLALARSANHLIASGETEDGLRADRLAREAGYASDKHIREHLDAPWLRLWGALAIRLIIAQGAPLIAEHMFTTAVRVKRDASRIGLDARTGVARMKPLLRLFAAGRDCQLVDAQIPLSTATRFDRGDALADAVLIADTELTLGEPLAGSLADHVGVLLDERATLLERVESAAVKLPALFYEVDLDPRTVAARAFPSLLILGPMPHGSPEVQGETYARIVMPGDDPSIVEHAHASGLAGIAACSLPSSPPSSGSRVDAGPRLAAEFGVTASALDGTIVAADTEHLYEVTWAESGTRRRYWRTFGMASDDPRAAALVHRESETWAETCMERADEQAPVGLVRGRSAAWRRTEYALLAVADAARVIAQRQRRTAAARV